MAGLTRHAFSAFGGADCEIIAVNGSPDEVLDLVAEVTAFERRLSRFDPASELSALNTSSGLPFEASPLLRALLVTALDAFELSEGLVNVAVHDALVRAGYDRTITDVRARPRPLVTPPLAAPIPVPSLPEVLEVGERSVRLAPGHRIDLGGVAKGWLADRLVERFDNVVVNLGGDLRACGEAPNGDGWPIGLCDASVVALRDGGAATSGTTARRWPGAHHLIDPRTGSPAVTDVRELSVVASTATVAEILAKGAALLGAGPGGRWLEARGITHWVVST